ncbi:MAG: metalloregulator ArsR/SmtB family transcription factor [Spirochaetia bacterium]|nr:metalloregulator ArsR/SmtB family transcription factor [Spirochaetia bacterium]
MINKASEFPAALAQLAEFAKAFSHPARIRILKTIGKRGECICGELVDVMPLAQSTVSQHLRELKSVGLIRGETEGVTSCYCIDWKTMNRYRSMMNDFFQEMESCQKSQDCC